MAVYLRRKSLVDICLTEAGVGLRAVAGDGGTGRAAPGSMQPEPALREPERALSAALMRVNHAGEVAAQALYRGQALLARDAALRADLLDAAADERDHLDWCRARVRQLGSHTSVLAPAWYAGSFLLGMAAGLVGDRASLGFLAETERQVAAHLDRHLKRLPSGDNRSREIVRQMREDEIRHGTDAKRRGGDGVPGPVRLGMTLASRVMTAIAHRV